MAEIKMPPFMRGKKQLEKIDIDWSRELSAVRIHVEYVIGKSTPFYKEFYLTTTVILLMKTLQQQLLMKWELFVSFCA